jgi:hypothetical protein
VSTRKRLLVAEGANKRFVPAADWSGPDPPKRQ